MSMLATMTALVIAQATQTRSTPLPKPHLHYEIRLDYSDISKLPDSQRLRVACDLAKSVIAKLDNRGKSNGPLQADLVHLRVVTCGLPNSN
jgi:hypothetical protein